MKKILFGLIASVMFSFIGNSQTLRADFLRGKSHEQSVDAFNKLSEGQQKSLWLEKIDQLLSLNLPSEHEYFIREIRIGIDQGVDIKQLSDFLQNVTNLAKITPMLDFGNMFETLNDYEYNGKFTDTRKVPDTIINDLSNLDIFSDANSSTARGKCSCRWCLGHEGHTGTNCNPTSGGCGFLWMQSCNQCILCL